MNATLLTTVYKYGLDPMGRLYSIATRGRILRFHSNTMPYESVDKLQRLLADEVFGHTKEPKKAAGRALGTLVEILTYYLLKTWGLNNSISIEKGLAEYGNADITHNVEYSLHPILHSRTIPIPNLATSITSNKILKTLTTEGFDGDGFERSKNTLLSKNILRNACTIATSQNSYLLASIKETTDKQFDLHIYEQHKKCYAIFECKRVGVEEGTKKGPQTIEKAKQGAYVARTASSLQKIRTENGTMNGIIYRSDDTFIIKPFVELMEDVIASNDKELLRRFILTVGVVSNHGNWFTAENHNKELKVLASSYDWLIFLTDAGLSNFIDKLITRPEGEYQFIRDTFLSSYAENKKKNQFTKVQMNLDADRILLKYFSEHLEEVEKWFNVISPRERTLEHLKIELHQLKDKDWKTLLA